MAEPESRRWARTRTALTASVLVALAVVGLGTPLVVSNGKADDDATTAREAGAEPSATSTPSPTATPDEQVTLEPAPKKREPKRDKPGKNLVDKVKQAVKEKPSVPPATFRVSSFNVLGASHTARGGNKPWMRSGEQRMSGAVGLLRSFGVDVVGFQEFESVQFGAFNRMTGGSWGIYPGLQLGRNAVRNSIAWKRDVWTAVSLKSIPIPYFSGNRVKMPYVLLEHNASGRKVWFINVHNPASTKRHPGNERWRDVGTAMEIALVNRLQAETGFPVVLMGDFNEREESFCKITSRSSSRAAQGGSTGGACAPPALRGIDWIFGTDDITFTDYGFRRSAASDHPIISSTATLAD